MNKLQIPCSYQGGKQRLAKQIVDIFFNENNIDGNTKFYDLCCGSGAISIELINRGIHPNNIIMIDNGCFGSFWQSIANDRFELDIFKNELDKIPKELSEIQQYLKNLSNKPLCTKNLVYHYLILQAGAFGSKQIWIEDNKWKNNTFRNYWLPTETSSRRSPVNPMMPMPNTLYDRIKNIVNYMGGSIIASKESVFDSIYRLDEEWDVNKTNNIIIYIDPPYINTTGYKETFNIMNFIHEIRNECPIYVSEGYSMYKGEKNKIDGCKKSILLSNGRNKGNISGRKIKKPTDEWLNIF
jgi:16S rRNA G966 N2-methylase RsmD